MDENQPPIGRICYWGEDPKGNATCSSLPGFNTNRTNHSEATASSKYNYAGAFSNGEYNALGAGLIKQEHTKEWQNMAEKYDFLNENLNAAGKKRKAQDDVLGDLRTEVTREKAKVSKTAQVDT